MIHLLPLCMGLLLAALPAAAQGQPEQKKTFFTTQSIKVADPHIELDNGRTYILKNGTVTEEIKFNAANIQRNIFDFANGIVYHESPRAQGSVYSTTPFKDLPPGRVEEIRALGCQVIEDSGLLVKNKGDVADFNDRYCTVKKQDN